MAYQVLARKSRPQDFSSVVGQAAVVTALRNALAEQRVAQAYLFAGIRGVGKTSVARVFAKALNCERGPSADPCNECTTCIEITKGSDLDVIEVDAATYSKVEQVRELTESLQYGPTRDRYKVVVIDEIHRLSRQAFDALLKIVEEPPERVVFIFATTEIDAVPATVLSRCQEFHFRRVAFGDLAAHLRRLCGTESIEASDTALRLIARAAEGSVRDAVALLDQMATFGSGTIDDADAARLTGGLDADFHESLLTAIVSGDSAAICVAVARLEQEGWDPRNAYGQLLAYLRDALHLAVGAEIGDIDLPQEQAASLAEIAGETGSENLLRILHLLLASEMTVRRSESGALAAEIAWLRAAELPKLTRIEAILSGIPPSGGSEGDSEPSRAPRRRKTGGGSRSSKPPGEKPAPAAAAPRDETTDDDRSDKPRDMAAGDPSGPPVAKGTEPRPESPPSEPSPPADQTIEARNSAKNGSKQSEIARLLEEVARRKQFLAAHLAEAEAIAVRGACLEIAIPDDDTWLEDSLRRDGNRKALEESIAAVWGEGYAWSLISSGRPSTPTGEQAGVPAEDDIMSDPEVQTVLELFGGTVETTAATTEDDDA